MLLVLAISLLGCSDNEKDETLSYEVIDIDIVDLGKITTDLKFDIYQENNSDTIICHLTTNVIKTGDVVKSIHAMTFGRTFKININTSPNDFSCNDSSCFSIHDLKFNIIGLNKGNYNVTLGINNVYGIPFNLKIN